MDIEDQWYWDRRIDKAFYPIESDDGTVTLLSVWHKEEVSGAIENGAFDPLEEVGGENEGFDHFDSFRIADEETVREFVTDNDE